MPSTSAPSTSTSTWYCGGSSWPVSSLRVGNPIRSYVVFVVGAGSGDADPCVVQFVHAPKMTRRSEEHTSELQSRENLVCRLLLEKKKKSKTNQPHISYAGT